MTERARVEGSLPQGTVTFLFTDIEASTRIPEAPRPDDYGKRWNCIASFSAEPSMARVASRSIVDADSSCGALSD